MEGLFELSLNTFTKIHGCDEMSNDKQKQLFVAIVNLIATYIE